MIQKPSNAIHIPSVEELKKLANRHALEILGVTAAGLIILSAPEAGLVFAVPRALMTGGWLIAAGTMLNTMNDSLDNALGRVRK